MCGPQCPIDSHDGQLCTERHGQRFLVYQMTCSRLKKIQPTLVWAFITFVKLVPMLFVSFTKMLPVLLTVQPYQNPWVRETIGFRPHCASPYSGMNLMLWLYPTTNTQIHNTHIHLSSSQQAPYPFTSLPTYYLTNSIGRRTAIIQV